MAKCIRMGLFITCIYVCSVPWQFNLPPSSSCRCYITTQQLALLNISWPSAIEEAGIHGQKL